MKNKVNVGMVGYGFMGKIHSFAYHIQPMFYDTNTVPVMKIICGRNGELVANASKKYGWESYETDWKKLTDNKELNLIDISTPNITHKEIVIAAAESGKDIICEKPLATNLNDAEEMLAAVEKAGVKHMICFNYQKTPAIGLAKKLIEEGKIGKIYHFRAVYLQDWVMDPNVPCVWRLQKSIAGSGVLGDLLSHTIQIARYLIGEFSEVTGMQETFVKQRPKPKQRTDLDIQMFAELSNDFEDISVDDATLFLARFKNGALGSFESSRYANGRKNGMRIEINGSKGSILFEQENMNILWFYSSEDKEDVRGFKKIQTTEPEHPYMSAWWPVGHIIGYENTFVHLIYDFMKAKDENKMPYPNFIDGVECQRVIDAVERSVRGRNWVDVKKI